MAQSTTELTDVDGGRVEVWVARDPDRGGAAPLVFLHEGLGSMRQWRGVPASLHGATARRLTIAGSRHGYGASAPAVLPRPVTYLHEEADAALPALLAAYGIDRPILVGHSDGASIALLYAGAGGAVTGLVLIAPHVFVEDVTIAAIEAARVAYETTNLRDRLARYHRNVDAAFHGWNDVWLDRAFRTWNIEDRLASIGCPVLLVQGELDTYGTSAQLDAIEAQVAGPVRRAMVAGAGHSPHLEAAETTTAAIAAFVTEIDPPAGGSPVRT